MYTQLIGGCQGGLALPLVPIEPLMDRRGHGARERLASRRSQVSGQARGSNEGGRAFTQWYTGARPEDHVRSVAEITPHPYGEQAIRAILDRMGVNG
jgi:hypothetical protein